MPLDNSILKKVEVVDTITNVVHVDDNGGSITVDGVVSVSNFPATQPVSVASLPLPTGASTESTLGTRLSESDFDTKIGSLTETAPATDIASSGLNGRLQRIAQRITSLIALFPTSLGQKTGANSLAVVTSKEVTYSATTLDLLPAATPTDIFTITGSATKTVKIKSIRVSALKTVNGLINLVILKRSTANSSSVPPATSPTRVPNDSADAAATATVLAYTANPTTPGTLVGNIVTKKYFVQGGTAQTEDAVFEWNSDSENQPTLRGTSEVLAVNLNGTGTTMAGGSWDITIVWTEE